MADLPNFFTYYFKYGNLPKINSTKHSHCRVVIMQPRVLKATSCRYPAYACQPSLECSNGIYS